MSLSVSMLAGNIPLLMPTYKIGDFICKAFFQLITLFAVLRGQSQQWPILLALQHTYH